MVCKLPTNHNGALPGCAVHFDWLIVWKAGATVLPNNHSLADQSEKLCKRLRLKSEEARSTAKFATSEVCTVETTLQIKYRKVASRTTCY